MCLGGGLDWMKPKEQVMVLEELVQEREQHWANETIKGELQENDRQAVTKALSLLGLNHCFQYL